MGSSPSIVRLNAYLSSLVRSGDHREALLLFQRMHRRRSISLDAYSFSAVLAACSAAPESATGDLGLQAHTVLLKTGCSRSTVALTALLRMYGKMPGSIDRALQLFDEMPHRDSVAWNALLSCLVDRGYAGCVLSTFRSMQAANVAVTGFTLCTLLNQFAFSRVLRLGRQTHALIVAAGYSSLVISTALINLYFSCGMLTDAYSVFGSIEHIADTATQNAMIAGLVQNRQRGAVFLLLGKMKPNPVALSSALGSCSEPANLILGKQVHCRAIRHGFKYDVILCNALINMYSKSGDLAAAQTVFDRHRSRTVVTWTSMIEAYGRLGRGTEALMLFREMQRESAADGDLVPPPNMATFLAVLSACSYSGMFEEGRECFYSMKDEHGMVPAPEHFACLIDLLGRAGRIQEAWKVYDELMNRDGAMVTAGICIALLNACAACSDWDGGAVMAKRVLEMDPTNSGSYVLVSNLYAAMGSWDQVAETRWWMKVRGIVKSAGSSLSS